jgi:hypothetical protein
MSFPSPPAEDDSIALSPMQRTGEVVVRCLLDTLAGDTILCKHYDTMPATNAEPAVRAI